MDDRIDQIIKAVEVMKEGKGEVSFPTDGDDAIAHLGQSLFQLNVKISHQSRENEMLLQVIEKINQGIVLEQVLNYTYESFKSVMPYDRLGFALISEDGKEVKSHWIRSESPEHKIDDDYVAPLEGSSLQKIVETKQPRIINNLHDHLKQFPTSESTKKILVDGIQSSLTCPLLAHGRPIGFLFFSSQEINTYQDIHVDFFIRVAGHISLIAEKSMMYQQLVELNDLKNKFLGIAAHDLRTPLAIIQTNLNIFEEGLLGDVSEKQKEFILIMKKWCGKMLTLITDLLDVSAIESGKIELKVREIDISEFLKESFGMFQNLARSKSIELKLDVSSDLPLVSFDPDRINQVINNLIGNALKFSMPETSVIVKCFQEGKEIGVSVIDQGPGIPEQELSKLFNFFSKTSVRPTSGEASSGLGLAISQRMVQAHGGRICVTSQVGEGSQFTFFLPLAPNV